MEPSTLSLQVKPAPRAADLETAVRVLARTLRHKREEAEALVRLVQQAAPSEEKGQHVNYYA
jgi:hypothetical protein